MDKSSVSDVVQGNPNGVVITVEAQAIWRMTTMGPLLLTWFNFNPSMDK